MIKTFTFVKKNSWLSDVEFFDRWLMHTKEYDLVDHPYIKKNRLMLISGHSEYVGIAENHWPSVQKLLETDEFYKNTEKGKEHWADLESFMDIKNSPTVVISHEAEVDDKGIHKLFPL